MVQKILVLAANPKATSSLRLDQEMREIEEGLRRSRKNEQFVLEKRLAVRIEDLRRALLDDKPIFVHFCGHGVEQEGILLEDLAGYPQLVKAEPLANLFKLFSNQIKCVILNACYSEIQATAISKYIDYVIGMKEAIGDQASIQFSTGFYDAIGAGRSINDAFEFGKNAIQLHNIPENLIPILKNKRTNYQINYSIVESQLHLTDFYQQDSLLEVIISPIYRERVHLLRERATKLMSNKGYTSDIISAFSICLEELTTNALEHGCYSSESEVYISIEIHDWCLILIVRNQDNIKLDLEALLNKQIALISSNPYSRRGRGLITVYKLSDSLESIFDGFGIKVTIYRVRVKFNIQSLEGLMIIQALKGLYNPSITRRLVDAASNCKEECLIIHIPGDTTTKVVYSLLDLHEVFTQAGRRFVVFLGTGWEDEFNVELLPSDIIAHSWNEALKKVGKDKFKNKIQGMCRDKKLF